MPDYLWWQTGTVYEIYVRSFADGDGDGVGDLAGIISKIDYLTWLGVDAIWLTPFYPSPMADFGYDVADYCDVDPLFGTLAGFDGLVVEAHRRGLKVIVDFVPNHTSDRHAWFIESRSSRQNPKRDWYIWRDSVDGGAPNNWLSIFGGSAWQWDDATGQYYYHAFLKEQPDLNWRNPAVQAAMLDAMRFWLGRGVDGFRVDVIWHLIKDEAFRANPPNPDYTPAMQPYHSLLPTFSSDRPEVHQIIERMRALIDSYDARMMVGEIYLPLERLVTYYGSAGEGVNLPFNFQLIETAWRPEAIGAAIEAYEKALPAFGWPNWVLGNHDRSRIASRAGAAQARVAAMLLLTLRGTPTLYYGDELGMGDVAVPEERIRDPVHHLVPGFGLGRDPVRTPMQWTGARFGGFSRSEPWLPLAGDFGRVNVEAEREDPASMLNLYRRLLRLRREEPALHLGSYRGLPVKEDVLCFLREWQGQRLLVALNFGATEARVALPDDGQDATVLLSTALDRWDEMVSGVVSVRPNEGLILRLVTGSAH